MPPIISIVGKSDSGKTTLLEKLIAEIKNRGYHIGTIKHDTHGFDIDREGKDTWRHKKAGASTVAISSPTKVAIIKDINQFYLQNQSVKLLVIKQEQVMQLIPDMVQN